MHSCDQNGQNVFIPLYRHQMIWAMPRKLQIQFIVQEGHQDSDSLSAETLLSIYYSPLSEMELRKQSRDLNSFNPDTLFVSTISP